MNLNRSSKRVLKGIIHSKPTLQGIGYDLYKLEKPNKMDDNEFIENIRYLERVGAIQFSKPGNPGAFLLTTEGKHYFEFKWIEFRQFLVKSILVPIFVSLLTTGALYLIESLLSRSPGQG